MGLIVPKIKTMDRFQEMQVFSAVVDAGSFVGASDALDMSKAAVSRHVAELESRLGVRLLHRTTRKLSLTEEGEVFHARCRELLSDLAEAEAEVSEHSGQALGVLKVSAPVSFGLLHMAPLWAPFMTAHPQLVLDITLSERIVDLVDEGFDVARAHRPVAKLLSRQPAPVIDGHGHMRVAPLSEEARAPSNAGGPREPHHPCLQPAGDG